ncbi:MAG: acetate--CoA ligase family protein [Spirochaetaceae bacterium]
MDESSLNNRRNQLDHLFYPRSIAVVGSVKSGRIGKQIITQLREGGFSGSLWAVNPSAEGPEGYEHVHTASSIEEVEEKVDCAVICAPASQVHSIVEQCGTKKVPAAVIITSGFSEVGNTEEEIRLTRTAEKHGTGLIGPNCAGIMNPHNDLFASIEVRALPGSVAFVSQSGAVGGAVLAMAETRGIGFSKFISYGNCADIGEIQLLEYLEQDKETTAIALYIESLQEGRGFMETAKRICRKKPLILIKAGRTGSGARAAGSHTGSFAGSDEVFNAMVSQTGALRVEGIEEMLDLVEGFSKFPPSAGRRTAIVTNSGGPGILTADKAEQLGLDIAEPEAGTKDILRAFLPSHSSVSNPIDLTVEGSDEDFRMTIEAVLAKEYDAVIAINVATPFLDSSGLAEGIAEAAHKFRTPVAAVFMAGRIVESGQKVLDRERIASFPTGERAARVLSSLTEYHRSFRVSSSGAYSYEPSQEKTADEPPLRSPILRSPVLLSDAAEFLQKRGFVLPEFRHGASKEEVRRAAQELSFPLVMKVISPEIAHKSDVGGVALDLNSVEETLRAFDRMHNTLQNRGFRGVFLHEQIPQGLEMILGIKRDPVFGPVVVIGAGGIYTELMRDVSLRIAPITREEALAMVKELKVHRLLTGFRGKDPLSIDSLLDHIELLSSLAMEHREISELDLNPLFVLPDKAVVGDIHIVADAEA